MVTRWMKEFRKANHERLRQLSYRRLSDPRFSQKRLSAAEARIDELEEPEMRAMDEHWAREKAHLDAVSEQLDELIARAEELLRTGEWRPPAPALPERPRAGELADVYRFTSEDEGQHQKPAEVHDSSGFRDLRVTGERVQEQPDHGEEQGE